MGTGCGCGELPSAVQQYEELFIVALCVKTNCCSVRTLRYVYKQKCVWGAGSALCLVSWLVQIISSILYSQNLRQSSDYLLHIVPGRPVEFILWSNFFQTCVFYFSQENTLSHPEARVLISDIKHVTTREQLLHYPALNMNTKYYISNY